jgi:hypothetical protein
MGAIMAVFAQNKRANLAMDLYYAATLRQNGIYTGR